ncbi:MAG: alpha/beta fold hydrolase [Myxococcales bacterium]|nr:alpha/beta fold hydrolase [Myxococcales bacterium]
MATFVLVHGAFTGGWHWQRVRRALVTLGHEVYTPTLTGAGERSHQLSRDLRLSVHVKDVTSVLFYEDLRDVVLVGHSYGGVVITAVAEQAADRISQLVYLDATVPAHGQAATGAFSEGTADVLSQLSSGTDWLLPPLPLSAVGVSDPRDVEWMSSRRGPHPMATLHEPVLLGNDAAQRLPRAYIRCTRREGLVGVFGVDPLLPFYQKAIAEGWPVRDLDSGHDAMVTVPEQVAATLSELAGLLRRA